jgi:hypothetical protein
MFGMASHGLVNSTQGVMHDAHTPPAHLCMSWVRPSCCARPERDDANGSTAQLSHVGWEWMPAGKLCMVLSSLLFAGSGLLVKLLAAQTVPTFLTVAVRSFVVAMCTYTVQHQR